MQDKVGIASDDLFERDSRIGDSDFAEDVPGSGELQQIREIRDARSGDQTFEAPAAAADKKRDGRLRLAGGETSKLFQLRLHADDELLGGVRYARGFADGARRQEHVLQILTVYFHGRDMQARQLVH